ncbi:MAG: diguanylate cyclase, partial [Calditrichaceae bacterium]
KYANLPIIILTSSDDIKDKVDSFDEGADEYITKEMDRQEIEKRLTSIIRRYRQNLDSNPLTHLPGNNVIQHEIQRRISAGETFAACYCDLDNFKAYNDAYGFVEGDQIIRFSAEVIKKSLKLIGNSNDFLGHIGGDDFIFLTTPDKAENICNQIFSLMDEGISGFYTEEDRNQGYIISKNRQGEEQQFPLVSISIAVVSNDLRPISSLAEVSKIASELKKVAKNKPGNSYAFDQRIQ